MGRQLLSFARNLNCLASRVGAAHQVQGNDAGMFRQRDPSHVLTGEALHPLGGGQGRKLLAGVNLSRRGNGLNAGRPHNVGAGIFQLLEDRLFVTVNRPGVKGDAQIEFLGNPLACQSVPETRSRSWRAKLPPSCTEAKTQ